MVHPSSPCKSGQHTLLLENFPPIEAGCTTVQIWLFLTPFLVPLETLLMNDGQGTSWGLLVPKSGIRIPILRLGDVPTGLDRWRIATSSFPLPSGIWGVGGNPNSGRVNWVAIRWIYGVWFFDIAPAPTSGIVDTDNPFKVLCQHIKGQIMIQLNIGPLLYPFTSRDHECWDNVGMSRHSESHLSWLPGLVNVPWLR